MNKLTLLFGRVGVFFDELVKKTPVAGNVRKWTEERATNSKASREILRIVVYFCLGLMLYIIKRTFDLILAGKLDATAGTVIGGVFTLLGGILAVTIPAFVSALSASSAGTPPPPVNPDNPPPTA